MWIWSDRHDEANTVVTFHSCANVPKDVKLCKYETNVSVYWE
jgi:hypothetical protein